MESELDGRFRDSLNRHGYGFQYAVVQAIGLSSQWRNVATEFPVTYRDWSSHIDIIAAMNDNIWMVGECKRANPKLSRWVFAKSPFTFDRSSTGSGWLEELLAADNESIVPRTRTVWLPKQLATYHIAAEAKADKTGDASGSKSVLNDALTQADMAVNGLITTLSEEKRLLRTMSPMLVLPVIFTTADLYTTSIELHLSDLETGELPPAATFTKQPYVWFEHNVSPDLLHRIQRLGSPVTTFASLLQHRHTRTMAIVAASGIAQFLDQVPHTLRAVMRP